jgi:hypothetical protein
MTTTAATWFYQAPEKRPYFVAERVRTSFWDQRVFGLWLDTVSVESPVAMEGTHNGNPVKLAWEPGHWFRLATKTEDPGLAGSVSNLLRLKPVLRYTDLEGFAIWEWWVKAEDGERRWQEVQGKPAFGSPRRLKP